MSERPKYFLVTAKELYEAGIEPEDLPDILTRPVPEWAEYFTAGKVKLWQCTGADGESLQVSKYEEIKK